MNNSQLRVSHLSDARQTANAINGVLRRTDPLELSSDQLTVEIDRALSVAGATSVTGNFDAAGTIRSTATTNPTSGVGLEIYHNGLTGASGVGTIMSYDRGSSAYGALITDALSLTVKVSGTAAVTVDSSSATIDRTSTVVKSGGATIATVDSASVNLASGKVLKVNNTQVVTARQTGWSADTGTDKRTANATYTAGSTLTFTDPPTAAEMSALATRLAAVEAAVQNNSRTMKSLKADLTTHGLIGA